MKKKVKLLFSIVLLILSISCLTFGVYAATTSVEYGLGGTIKYEVTDVSALISEVTYTTGTVTSLTDGVTPLSEINFNKQNASQDDQVATWDNLLLKFNDNGDNIVISFKLTNLNRGFALKFAGEKAAYDYSANNVNCNIVVKNMSDVQEEDITNIVIPAATTTVNSYVTVEITFSLVSRLTGASISDFNIPFTLTSLVD